MPHVVRLPAHPDGEMSMLKLSLLVSFLLIAVLSFAPSAQAQPSGGNGGPPDFAQMRQQFAERIKEMLGTPDDEWKVLQPMIEKVQQLQREGFPRGMGPGGPDANQPQSAAQVAAGALRALTDNDKAAPADIKTALDAVRKFRAKAKADLSAAQEELRAVLTSRQEATLVLLGMLE
jgi:hypothetical protein